MQIAATAPSDDWRYALLEGYFLVDGFGFEADELDHLKNLIETALAGGDPMVMEKTIYEVEKALLGEAA